MPLREPKYKPESGEAATKLRPRTRARSITLNFVTVTKFSETRINTGLSGCEICNRLGYNFVTKLGLF